MALYERLMIYFLTVNYYSKILIEGLMLSICGGITGPYKILIINNSPQEAEIHELVSQQVTVIESGSNLGFGRACNLGLERIYRADPSALVWLINPDATLDSKADLHIQSCFESHPSLAILGTQIRNTEGTLWFSAGKFNPWTGYINHNTTESRNVDTSADVLSTPWVSGCSMIINLAQFDHCPTFDPSYFLYFEDADLCERYSRQGYSVGITSRALVTHQVSAIIGKNTQVMFRHYTFGRLLFLWRYATFLGFSLYFLYLISKILILVIKDPENARGRWQGLTNFLIKNTSGPSLDTES
jgi:N-acetylglucosaminyl-diphospho-decaprenol L-rhamnosyltransferase